MGSERNATMTDQDEDEGLDEDQEDLEDEESEESEESGESEDEGEGEGDDSSSSSADEAPPAPPGATPPKGRKKGANSKSASGKSAPSKPAPAPVTALAKDNGKSKSTSRSKGKPSTPPKSAATALDKSRISRIAQAMHLVTDVTRLTILNLLMVEGEMYVGDICNRVEQTQPAVSHHLALLRVSGIIEPDRRGKHNFYMLTESGKRLTKIFEYVE